MFWKKTKAELLQPSSPLFDYLQSLVGIVYSWDYDGIWSSSIPQLSFLINENILVECFRFSLSWIAHRISPLAIKYKPPRLFLLFTLLNSGASHLKQHSLDLSFHSLLFHRILRTPVIPAFCSLSSCQSIPEKPIGKLRLCCSIFNGQLSPSVFLLSYAILFRPFCLLWTFYFIQSNWFGSFPSIMFELLQSWFQVPITFAHSRQRNN